MQALDPKYKVRIDNIAQTIQNSDLLAQYLEEEEEEQFKAIQTEFEPQLAEIYTEVAQQNPLQIIAMEECMLSPDLEGLFLPRILGYAVLRGETNERCKYIRPQDHFKKVITAICNSSNFEYIKLRIGQTVQMGLALSSDIWVTNLINEFSGKRVKYYLQSQKVDHLRIQQNRADSLIRYKKQFAKENFYTAAFPTTISELKYLYPSIKTFLLNRIKNKFDNSTVYPQMLNFLKDEQFYPAEEHLYLLIIFSKFLTVEKDQTTQLSSIFNQLRNDNENFSEKYMEFLLELYHFNVGVGKEESERMHELLASGPKDDISEYYDLMQLVFKNGFHHEKAIEAVRYYYSSHEGLSINNKCVRRAVLNHINTFITNISVEEYVEWFELAKIFPAYMDTFSNQKFNQEIKTICLVYIKKLLKRYKDKRGKDYQDIKKFVKTTFLDLNFMSEKQLVELFKTKRKKKVVES